MAHPIDTVVIDNTPVGKANFRTYVKQRTRLKLSLAELRASDYGAQTGGVDIDGAHYNLDTTDNTTADDGAVCIIDFAGHRFKLGFITAPTFVFPAGSAGAPGLGIGQSTSGLCQLSANIVSVVNHWQGTTAILQNHGNVSVADNHSLLIGSPTGQLMRVNHGAIEITRLGKKLSGIGASVPMQLNEYESDTSASEPIVFYRSKATTKGGVGVVAANDVLGLIQGQGDDGVGGSNPVAVNIGMRVKPGSTVAADKVPGEFYIATQDDAGNPVATRFKASDDGATISTGALMFGPSQDVAIDASRNGFLAALTASGIITAAGGTRFGTPIVLADDIATSITIPGGKGCILAVSCTNTPAAAVPFGFIAVRVDAANVPVAIAFNTGTTIVGFNTSLGNAGGTDGALNFGTPGDSKVYISNRLGGSRTLSLTLISIQG